MLNIGARKEATWTTTTPSCQPRAARSPIAIDDGSFNQRPIRGIADDVQDQSVNFIASTITIDPVMNARWMGSDVAFLRSPDGRYYFVW